MDKGDGGVEVRVLVNQINAQTLHNEMSYRIKSHNISNCSLTRQSCNTREDRKDADYALQMIEYLTANAKEVQDQVLATILRRNSCTEYLTSYGLNSCIMSPVGGGGGAHIECTHGSSKSTVYCDCEDHVGEGGPLAEQEKASFKRLLPVVSYEDMEPYICRIANGDTSSILSSQPITEFLTSSGTSGGERKLMPSIPEELERKEFLYSLLMPVMNQYLPGLDKGKGLYFLFIKSETTTPGGLLARPVLTSYYKSPQFINAVHDPFNVYTSPMETILCPDSFQSMYCQMLCGLIQYSEVLRMGAVFASGFLRAIKFFEEHWQELCNDIRHGNLSEKITDPRARAAVMRILTSADGELADRFAAECSKASWQGIISRIWPRVLYIEVVVTGTMSQYIPTLDFYSGGLPLVCSMYASSECYFGINLKPLSKPSEVSYTILPNMGYFEFIPFDRSVSLSNNECNGVSSCCSAVDLTEVEIGKYYELVVTTYAGLYRYKVGDVLCVTGFYNNTPQFKFVCRKNVILSIDADKTDEDCLHKAVLSAFKRLQSLYTHARLGEYTSFSDTGTIPGHYVIFWELQETEIVEAALLEICCLCLEEALDSVYRQCRNCDRSIGPLEIRIVESGSFDKLMDHQLVSTGSSINQYKTPRCIKSSPALELLNSRVIQRSFSPRCPFWAPQRKDWAAS